jgi:hypothetical protein
MVLMHNLLKIVPSTIHCCTGFEREVWVEPTQDNTKENQASPSLYIFTTQKNRCCKSGDDNEPRNVKPVL